jgi:hypothetical protein
VFPFVFSCRRFHASNFLIVQGPSDLSTNSFYLVQISNENECVERSSPTLRVQLLFVSSSYHKRSGCVRKRLHRDQIILECSVLYCIQMPLYLMQMKRHTRKTIETVNHGAILRMWSEYSAICIYSNEWSGTRRHWHAYDTINSVFT